MEFAVIIGIGGGCGAVMRFLFGKFIRDNTKISIPVNTMLINIIGTTLLALSLAHTKEVHLVKLIQTGILGGFTTYSTFMVEGFNLYKKPDLKGMAFYLFGTIIPAVLAFAIVVCLGL